MFECHSNNSFATQNKSNKMTKSIALLVLVAMVASPMLENFVDAHGRLLNPPMRSSLWRYNYSSPVNSDDDFLSCGYVQVK